MIINFSLFQTAYDMVCEFIMAIGSLGTVATFFLMRRDSKCKAKQIKTIQKIQSHQLESLYEPDIRICSWSGKNVGRIHNEIVIKNYGEVLYVLGIHELEGQEVLNKDGMRNWFPRRINKNEEMHIPMYIQLPDIHSHSIVIESRNRLGSIYESIITINEGKPTLELPIIKERNN